MKSIITNLFMLFFVCGIVNESFSQTNVQKRAITKNYDKVVLRELGARFSAEYKENYNKALIAAKKNNWPLIINKPDGGVSELQGITEDGIPIYYTTENYGSSITSRVNKIQNKNGIGLNLTGKGMTAGVWEQTRPNMNHKDLVGRIFEYDSQSEVGFHATHVTGTIISSGEHNPNGRGMAYEGNVLVSDWSDDLNEMADNAADAMILSNHSYGLIADNLPEWYFGAYLDKSKDLDDLTFNAPGYQPVVAAGNDNGKSPAFNPTKDGYDLLTKYATAKNAIVVAAVYEVLAYEGAESVEIAGFSSWGPTDDNRVKPDISTKGVSVISTDTNPNNIGYSSSDGTSMASPGITGSLLLLQQHYSNLYGNFMQSATVRALMIHTASEAGSFDGPDPQFGWGLMDAEKYAKVITDSKTKKTIISELDLKTGVPYTIQVKASGLEPLVATIDWTDRGGPANYSTIDKTTPVLMNNLDIRITKDNEVYFPWKLGETYSSPAVKGDNDVDNVEKIEIDSPVSGGVYTITVTNKKVLIGGSQKFSLVVSGIDANLTTNETVFKTFDVWPNPVKNTMNIAVQSQLSDDVYVTLYDVLGKRVFDGKLNFSSGFYKGELNVDFLNRGSYFVKILQGDKQSVRKIIKE